MAIDRSLDRVRLIEEARRKSDGTVEGARGWLNVHRRFLADPARIEDFDAAIDALELDRELDLVDPITVKGSELQVGQELEANDNFTVRIDRIYVDPADNKLTIEGKRTDNRHFFRAAINPDACYYVTANTTPSQGIEL